MKELKRLFTRKMIHRRVFSSLMAMMLVITSVIHPINLVPAYATSNWLEVNYQKQAKNDIELYVQAESASFEPGETITLDLFVQNNSSEEYTDFGISFKDNKDAFAEAEFILTDDCGEAYITEKGSVTDLYLAPGETKALQFEGKLYGGLDVLNRKEITFLCGGYDVNGEAVTTKTEFPFTVGLFNELSIDFTDGTELIPDENNTLEITIGFNDIGYYYDTDVATDSDADLATDSDAKVATDSDADEDYVFDLTNVTLDIETVGVKFQNVKLTDAIVDEVNGTITAQVSYKVDEDAEAGEYFGTVTANVKNGKKVYQSQTGFQFEVEEVTNSTFKKSGLFTAELDNFTVNVEVAKGAFDEKVELVVTELEEDSEAFKTAEEAMEASEREFDGMMALDICFINEDGEEVEPNEGYSVQVSIEMKAEVLPEGIDTESLMVHHIAETTTDDVEAEVELVVEDVADTADATAGIVEVKEVDEAPVVAAEFSVESFSTFTITWSSRTITVVYAKNNFNELSASGFNTTAVAANSSFDLNNYIKSPIVATDKEAYAISKIVLKESKEKNAKTLVEYQYNDLNENNTIKWQSSLNYYVNSSVGTQIPDKAVLYLVYEKNVPLTTFQGLNTQGVITVHVTDYSQGAKQGNFVINNTGTGGSSINNWTGENSGNSRGVRQGIVDKLLYNGYPAVTSNSENEKSLEKFFTGGWNANYLFQKDNDGYYYYDSYKNYAYLNKTSSSTGEFALYKVPHATGNDINYGSEPQFMPFNTITSALNKVEDDSVYYSFGENKNYYFGMMVEFEFTMPKGGKIDGNDMIFSFAGDDDVWVFIDDVLVLDMGGVHLSCEGDINFATGEVVIDKVYQYNNNQVSTLNNVKTSLAKLYSDAGRTPDYSDYSKHTLKFFYMERGAGGSNCTMRFNIQPIPAGTINFEKEIGYANVADAADIDFQFKAYVDKDGKDDQGNYNYVPYIGKYNVYNASDRTLKRANVDTSADGIILLKDGEMASLATGITAKSSFYIQEIGATSDKYDVYVNGSKILENDPATGIKDFVGVQSSVFEAGSNPYILFQNDVVAQN